MANIYLQEGQKLDYTPASDVDGGTFRTLGAYNGFISLPIKANKKGAFYVTGVVEADTATLTGSALQIGDLVGVNNTTQLIVGQGLGDYDLPVARDKEIGDAKVVVQLQNSV